MGKAFWRTFSAWLLIAMLLGLILGVESLGRRLRVLTDEFKAMETRTENIEREIEKKTKELEMGARPKNNETAH